LEKRGGVGVPMGLKYVIGIDLGTTMAKCAIYDSTGQVVAEAQREMEILYPRSGEAEQDAYAFYTISCELIKRCVAHARIEAGEIVALGVDSQMGGIMSIDRNFDPVTYYDTPLDSRSAEENRYMHHKFGDLIIEKNGSISTYGNKILYWKKRAEWRDIHRFIQPSGFVAGKLAGLQGDDAFIDESFLCFSGLSDLGRAEWSDELCGKLDVDDKKLPRIVKSDEIIGEVTREASEHTGLSPGTPICAGCGDQAAGFLGAGILSSGQMADVSGTACIFSANVDRFTHDAKHRTVACMKSAHGNSYYLLSVVLGGRTHKWFVDEFFTEERDRIAGGGGDIYTHLDEKAALLPPGSDGLIAIDYLQGRFFPPAPGIRGLFIGHTWAHNRYHFYRAILESIAYDHCITKGIIQELVPELDLKAVTAIGSGANSTFWMQLKADVLQVPYQNLYRSDLSTLGTALLAGHAVGHFSDIETTVKGIVKTKVKVNPAPGEDGKYRKYIAIYRELFSALKDVYEKISS
jgi:xylulokinase